MILIDYNHVLIELFVWFYVSLDTKTVISQDKQISN